MTGNPLIGAVVDGRYRILEPIAEGGMGAVYKAEHTALRKFVALKVLHREFLGERDFELRFQREAQAASRLSHANVVAVTDFGHTDKLAYLVMEYLQGRPLDKERLPMQPTRAVTLMRQVLAGLAHAHGAGVIHRDLKPANVMLVEVPAETLIPLGAAGASVGPPTERSADETLVEVAKILDFGMAKLADPTRADPTLTQVGLVVGTPRYMSPEQALAQENIDHRTDLYAAGVVLYELCVGEAPFMDESAARLLRAHAMQKPQPPRQRVPGLSPALERAILKALEKRPEDRFASAQEFQEVLAQVPEAGPRTRSVGRLPSLHPAATAPTVASGLSVHSARTPVVSGPTSEVIELVTRSGSASGREPAWTSGISQPMADLSPPPGYRPPRRRSSGGWLLVILTMGGVITAGGATLAVLGPARVRALVTQVGSRLGETRPADGGVAAPAPPRVMPPAEPEVPEPARRAARGTKRRPRPAARPATPPRAGASPGSVDPGGTDASTAVSAAGSGPAAAASGLGADASSGGKGNADGGGAGGPTPAADPSRRRDGGPASTADAAAPAPAGPGAEPGAPPAQAAADGRPSRKRDDRYEPADEDDDEPEPGAAGGPGLAGSDGGTGGATIGVAGKSPSKIRKTGKRKGKRKATLRKRRRPVKKPR